MGTSAGRTAELRVEDDAVSFATETQTRWVLTSRGARRPWLRLGQPNQPREFCNRRTWPTKAEARSAIGRWIEETFTRRRRHSAINAITPVQFGNHSARTATQAA